MTNISRNLESAVEDIDHAIRDLRNYIFGLRPGILADRQLDQALKEMATDFGARSGVVTVVDVDAEAASRLASRAADVVQIVREALSNVGRHGAATTCRVSVERNAAGLVIEVDDDGQGFDVERHEVGHGASEPAGTGRIPGWRLPDREHPRRGNDGASHVPVLTGPAEVGTFDPCGRGSAKACFPHVREVFRRVADPSG